MDAEVPEGLVAEEVDMVDLGREASAVGGREEERKA
jgi:hypothetical protein